MIYVYALTDPPEDLPTEPSGFGGTALQSVAVDGVAGVWSELVGARPERRAEDLWAHEAVAEALLDLGAVLPARFGTILEGPERLVELLERNRDVIAEALDLVRGHVEVGVRVAAEQVEDPDDEGDAQQPATGREYLEHRAAVQRRQRAARQRAEELGDRVHAPLADLAHASVRASGRNGQILSAAYLVPPTKVPELVAVARKLDAAHPDLQVVCTGPWPAHSFAPPLDLGAAT